MSALVLCACVSVDALEASSTEGSFEPRPYLGGGILISQLEPGVQQFDELSVDDDRGFGASFSLGYDLTSRLAIEGHFAALGQATLQPDGDIRYQVGGLSALVYGISEPSERMRREGLSVFGRAGLGTLHSDSVLPVERLNDVHLVLGAGLEYGLRNGLAGRFELVSHDSDAAYGQLGFVYRFGDSGFHTLRPVPALGSVEASSAESDASAAIRDSESSGVEGLIIQRRKRVPNASSRLSAPDEGSVDNSRRARTREQAVIDNPATGLLVSRRPIDEDNDRISDAVDECPETREGRPVDERGCDLFDGAVEGVTFQIASNRLTDSALNRLAEVAQALQDYPDIRVSIDAHTDNRGNSQDNLLLSKRRALEVTRYLMAQGIEGNRLMPNAYGETKPVGSNQTSEGRRRNRRVEFRILE